MSAFHNGDFTHEAACRARLRTGCAFSRSSQRFNQDTGISASLLLIFAMPRFHGDALVSLLLGGRQHGATVFPGDTSLAGNRRSRSTTMHTWGVVCVLPSGDRFTRRSDRVSVWLQVVRWPIVFVICIIPGKSTPTLCVHSLPLHGGRMPCIHGLWLWPA